MATKRIIAGAAALVACTSADQCDVAADARKDCGFFGITQDGCQSKGCCWRPAVNAGEAVKDTPWCFYPSGGPSPGPAPAPSKCSLSHKSAGAPLTDEEVAKVRSYFLANIDIQGSGAVVAAPDHNTGPGGDYYFHWERDGALSMGALLRTAKSLDEVDQQLQHYVSWVEKVQNQADPHGIDVRTEPKYTIPDGQPFGGAWCRPQTDGPGLRGKTLAEYGLALLKAGRQDFVKEHLWTGSSSKNGGTVKYDLDWVAANWQQNGCDLWEEIQSNDFFWGRYTMRAGLHVGAEFAEKMGDSASAARYRAAKADIEKTLMAHYNGDFVFEAQQRKKDAAVIEAFNDGNLDDGLFAPLSKEVLGTVITLNQLFCSSYDINQKDSAASIPGILYGRYEGDTYDGGNPWVLLSATLAELIYRQAATALAAPSVDPSIYRMLTTAYDVAPGLSGKTLGDALLGAADGVMLRIKYHVQSSDLHMAEQIRRSDGVMTSAKDLTWNYANVLKAMHARQAYVAAAASTSAIVV